jgi:GntR family transcriptional regulator of arabinose operon
MHSRKAARLTLEITHKLKNQITSGDFNPGDCIPSERTLLKQFNISRVTVRRSLRELVNEGLLINKIGSGYFLPTNADLINKETLGNSVVFLHSDESIKTDVNEIVLWQGAREFCIKNGHNIVVESLNNKTKTTLQLNEIKKIAAGIISDFNNKELVLQIHKAGIPVVQIYHPMEHLPIDTIVQDDLSGVQLAYEHLISKGHRRICFLDKSLSLIKEGNVSYNHLRRKLGYQFAAEQTLTYDPELIVNIDSNVHFFENDNECFAKIVKTGATALIFPNSINHQEIVKGLNYAIKQNRSHKNTVNAIKKNHFGIISWGEHIENSQPDLTTHVNWSKQQMGQEGVRRLFERIKEPNLPPVIIHIPTFLVEGNSSGKGPYYNKALN